MTVAELLALLDGIPPDTEVRVAYEQYAQAGVNREACGIDPGRESDHVFWIVAAD